MPDPNLSSFIWSVADLLRGDYKQSEYGKVILPFEFHTRVDRLAKAGLLYLVTDSIVRMIGDLST